MHCAYWNTSAQNIHQHMCNGNMAHLKLRDYLYRSLHFDMVVQQPHIHQSAHSYNQWCSQQSQHHRKSDTLRVHVVCEYIMLIKAEEHHKKKKIRAPLILEEVR